MALVQGEGGNDTLIGADGAIVSKADRAGTDSMAAAAQDRLSGGGGNDYLDAGSGSDRLYGDAGNDYPRSAAAETTACGAAAAVGHRGRRRRRRPIARATTRSICSATSRFCSTRTGGYALTDRRDAASLILWHFNFESERSTRYHRSTLPGECNPRPARHVRPKVPKASSLSLLRAISCDESVSQAAAGRFGRLAPRSNGPSRVRQAACRSWKRASRAGCSSRSTSFRPCTANPSAQAKLFLDFNGNPPIANWLGTAVPATPAFDRDGDINDFSTAELAAHQRDLAARLPRSIRRSTSTSPRRTRAIALDQRDAASIVIGGDGEWLGRAAGGVAPLGGFYNGAPNIGFVFSDDGVFSDTSYIAEAAAHEAGHLFGL